MKRLVVVLCSANLMMLLTGHVQIHYGRLRLPQVVVVLK